MCGLYGWNFNTSKGVGGTRREVMAGVLAINNSNRGDDSFGAYLMRANKAVIVRQVGDIAEAKQVSEWGRLPLVMAHTRQATHGEVTVANQHPFVVDHITLSHNGVIANHSELNHKLDRTCVVDSEHLAKHMAEGADFGQIQGYGAITWVDAKEPGIVKICRMRNGSLAVAGITIGTRKGAPQVGVVWSSDENHLRGALRAAGLDWFIYEKPQEGHVYEIKGGKLWVTDERINISQPQYIDTRVLNLTCGVKDQSVTGSWSWAQAMAEAVNADPTIESHVAGVVNDSRPASWAQRRAVLAKDLGLTQTSATKWVDEKGNMVTAEDLDGLMEAEFNAEAPVIN